MRLVATALAGGALAAAGQQILSDTLPGAVDGAARLLGAGSALSPAALAVPTVDIPAGGPASPTQAAPNAQATQATQGSSVTQSPVGTAAPPAATQLESAVPLLAPSIQAVAPSADPLLAEAPVADAASLVKAADLQSAADAAAAKKAADEAAKVEAAKVADKPAVAPGGGVQMIVGQVTSGFGGRWGTVHQGMDIAAPIGTPIHVPEAGTVISSGPASGFGMWVRVQHADGTITVYGHINRSFVKVGQHVEAGDVIAETGNRGQSTGPHLHIGVMIDGQYVNPKPWLDAHGVGY